MEELCSQPATSSGPSTGSGQAPYEAEAGVKERTRVPTTGMRGGLGRTLLTAFLVLAIVPLSAVSWYAATRGRHDLQCEVVAKLSSAAAMVETQVRRRIEDCKADLAVLAALSTTVESAGLPNACEEEASAASEALRTRLCAMVEHDRALRLLAVLDGEGRVLVSISPEHGRAKGGDEDWLARQAVRMINREAENREYSFGLQFIAPDPSAELGLMVIQRGIDNSPRLFEAEGSDSLWLVGWLDLSDLAEDIQTVGEETGEVYLVDSVGMAWPQGQVVTSTQIEAALAGESGEGLYENYAGVPVIGVTYWDPELGLALVAEQAQEEAFAATDDVTAAVIGATLVVALITAVIAAVVTRQITRPVVRLTESALDIAEGNLEQWVPVTSRDEIGILAYVFNRMAAELKSLYDDLEGKVAQRTALLQEANYQIQRRAIQMQASLEVGQVVASILDPDLLLEQVVRVVRERFAYSYAAVYTVEMNNEPANDELKSVLFLRASAGQADPFHGQQLSPDLPGPVGRALRTGRAVVESRPLEWSGDGLGQQAPYTRLEVALPLRLGEDTLGVLDVQSVEQESFDQDEVSVLQNVAYQITIALENARAYDKEKETSRRLRQTEAFRSRFLAHMSHELREPLTNIIGFSRLILKGLDGPISDQQRQDLGIIYANSQHLLGLINDLLDVSQIEAGLMELQFQELDLAEVIKSVMSTASALVRGKDIKLQQQIARDLPRVHADAARIRQVLLRLLANAAKFTTRGSITVRVWTAPGSPLDYAPFGSAQGRQGRPCDGGPQRPKAEGGGRQVLVSVSDTGVGIATEDQERIFERFEQGSLEGGGRPDGAGLGLALSKEFVEMHGGRIWVESQEGIGSTFTFALPLGLPFD